MNFNNIASELGLGVLKSPAERVFGGYMHKMYRLSTTKGNYAVKLLNPEVMKPAKKSQVLNRKKLQEISPNQTKQKLCRAKLTTATRSLSHFA